MSQYYPKDKQSWVTAPVRGGVEMQKCVIWEGDFGMRSGLFRMPEGMVIPQHTHPLWVQVMVIEGEMQVQSEADGIVSIPAGGCYFVEPGDTHIETAIVETLVLVTQGEDRPEFLKSTQ